jgi:AcrR family transcriptional regulator
MNFYRRERRMGGSSGECSGTRAAPIGRAIGIDVGSSVGVSESRRAEVRVRLIASAIEIIGRTGHETVSVKELIGAAQASLSEVAEYLGGRRALHQVGAAAIANQVQARVEALLARLDDPCAASAERRLEEVLSGFLEIVRDQSAPDDWTAYLAHGATDDDEAFHLIYEQALAPLRTSLLRAAHGLARGAIDEGDIGCRVDSMMAALVSLRLLLGIVLRGSGWKELRPRDGGAKGIARDFVVGGLLSGVAEGPGPGAAIAGVANHD